MVSFWKDPPKIAIRPIIDGRDPVRSTTAEQTLAMAQSVKRLLRKHLRYPDSGKKVKVIITNLIGGQAEAKQADAMCKRQGADITISVTPTWAYGSETVDKDPLRIKALMGFNGTERPGAVYLAAAMAVHAAMGLPAFSIYGRDVQNADDTKIPKDAADKLILFGKAALAVALMRNQVYLSAGNISMGIGGSDVVTNTMHDLFLMSVQTVDMTEIQGRIKDGVFDAEELKRALTWRGKHMKMGADLNPKDARLTKSGHQKNWRECLLMKMIIQDLMIGNPKLEPISEEKSIGHGAICGGFQGQRQHTDYFANGDVAEALLSSPFDWNGIRVPFAFATENDHLNGMGMLFAFLVSYISQIFADLRTYWSPDAVERLSGHVLDGDAKTGLLHCINSGPATLMGTGVMRDGKSVMLPHWALNDGDVKSCMKQVKWCPAVLEYFPGGGYSTQYLTPGDMPMTMHRLSYVKGLGMVLQVAEGYSVTLPPEVHAKIDGRTNPTWPTQYFVPILTGSGVFSDCYSVMDQWNANHCVLSYGHIGAELLTLASMLRIFVPMHNIPRERIFRPKTWGAFGTNDLEGADRSACQAYGPLYASM